MARGVVEPEEDRDVLSVARRKLPGAVDGIDEDSELTVSGVVDFLRQGFQLRQSRLDDAVELVGDHQIIDHVRLRRDVDLGLVLLPDNLGELPARQKVLNEHVLDDAVRDRKVRGVVLELRRAAVLVLGDLLVEGLQHGSHGVAGLLRDVHQVRERGHVVDGIDLRRHGSGLKGRQKAFNDGILADQLVAKGDVLVSEIGYDLLGRANFGAKS
mmetsp:Transcript_8769/g.15913  ORF Transcript_8769/g.15913 Transcript_8769/m.15913 type:complete len:213 (+) Transcript_8769:716-1354(+)